MSDRVNLSYAMKDVVSPHRSGPWIVDLHASRRWCKLLGNYHCVADFDITPQTLAPLAWEILDKLEGPEAALAGGGCDTLNVGLYDGGKDIRVWKVHFI